MPVVNWEERLEVLADVRRETVLTRVWMLSGWRRWLAHRAPELRREQEQLLEKRARHCPDANRGYGGSRGNWGVAVSGDVWARCWQQIEFRLKRASSSRSGHYGYLHEAHEAKRLAEEIELHLRPPDVDSADWREAFQWWRAPVSCYVAHDMSDNSYSLVGYDPCECGECGKRHGPGQDCDVPDYEDQVHVDLSNSA